MKKFLKNVMGLASVAAVAAGVYYVTKKWMDEKDELLDEDFEDFDLEDDNDDSREYVTLDLEDDEKAVPEESGEADESEEAKESEESEESDEGEGGDEE